MYTRNTEAITAEAALDGIYVLRTSVPADTLDPAGWSPPTRASPASNATPAP